MNNTLQIGKFYNIEGKVGKLIGYRQFDEKTWFDFELTTQLGKSYKVYDNEEAEKRDFLKLVDWCQERLKASGERLCDGEIVETFEEVTDCEVIAEWAMKKSMSDEMIAEFYEKNPQLNHD